MSARSSAATKETQGASPRVMTDEERAFTAELSKKAITIRAAPREESKIEDNYYMSKCDVYLHDALKQVEKPKLADFERLFQAFEKHFLDDPEMHPLYKMCLNEMAHVNTRMLMALHRYTT